MKYISILVFIFLVGCIEKKEKVESEQIIFENEKHLKNMKMLTFEGENAEAYFNPAESKLVYQSTHGQYKCDQIFTMNLDGSERKLVSTGKGRTTCAYFLSPIKIIYASTHRADSDCPPPADFSKGYVRVNIK